MPWEDSILREQMQICVKARDVPKERHLPQKLAPHPRPATDVPCSGASPRSPQPWQQKKDAAIREHPPRTQIRQPTSRRPHTLPVIPGSFPIGTDLRNMNHDCLPYDLSASIYSPSGHLYSSGASAGQVLPPPSPAASLIPGPGSAGWNRSPDPRGSSSGNPHSSARPGRQFKKSLFYCIICPRCRNEKKCSRRGERPDTGRGRIPCQTALATSPEPHRPDLRQIRAVTVRHRDYREPRITRRSIREDLQTC